jgi:taspase, threonine aspartase, 1
MNPTIVAAAIRQQTLRGSLSCGRLAPNMLVGDGATDFAFQSRIPVLSFDANASPAAVERWKGWSRDNQLWELRHGQTPIIQTSKDRLAAVSHMNDLRVQHVMKLIQDIAPYADPNPVESLYEEFQAFSGSLNSDTMSVGSPSSPPMEVATPTRGLSPEIPQMVDGPGDNKRKFDEAFENHPALAQSLLERRAHLRTLFAQTLSSPAPNPVQNSDYAPMRRSIGPSLPFRAIYNGSDPFRELLIWGNGGISPVATQTQRRLVARRINSTRNTMDQEIVSALNFLEFEDAGLPGNSRASSPAPSSEESASVSSDETDENAQLPINRFEADEGQEELPDRLYDQSDHDPNPVDIRADCLPDLTPMVEILQAGNVTRVSDTPVATSTTLPIDHESDEADEAYGSDHNNSIPAHEERDPYHGRYHKSSVHTDEGYESDNINDTVGVIVIDRAGNMACGSSSGGLGMKMRGRSGPAGIPHAGTAVVHADKDDPEGTMTAVVASGTGEYITSTCAAKMAAERLYYGQKKVAGGKLVGCDDLEVLAAFIEKEFLGKLSNYSPSQHSAQHTHVIITVIYYFLLTTSSNSHFLKSEVEVLQRFSLSLQVMRFTSFPVYSQHPRLTHFVISPFPREFSTWEKKNLISECPNRV